jgi:alpha-maltose-1-phosphate synthase
MRIGLLTREFPPDVYGGAGVHVEYLVRELARLAEVEVHCFGSPRAGATAHQAPDTLRDANPALQTLGIDLAFALALEGCDVAHSHTWYANMGGHLAKLLHGLPHVVTAHSLEPRRPWKAEQLGGGYRVSSWAERTAYEAADAVIAVSQGMRADILDCYPALDPDRVRVVLNGIDTEEYSPDPDTDFVETTGIDLSRPYALFVGRITRQKGLNHLVAAAHDFDPELQIVLCAGSPDTPEIGLETTRAVAALRAARKDGVIWVQAMVPKPDLIQLMSHAEVFVCPSVYEPLGIVNLEAMACRTAVVASDVGGIPEVVQDGRTGLLVHYDPDEPQGFEAGLAAAVNSISADPRRAAALGDAGRTRAVDVFGWDAIARQTLDVYTSVL